MKEDFDLEEYIKNSKLRQQDRQLIRENIYSQQKNGIKMIKKVVGGGLILTIMGIGITRYFPAMFKTYEASTNSNDYKSTNDIPNTSKLVSSKKTHPVTTIETTQATSLPIKTKKKYKITKKTVIEKKEKVFSVGNRESDRVRDFLDSYIGGLVKYYSECYGVDPNIIAAICMQESNLMHEANCPGGQYYNGYGVGICQLESPDGSETVCAYNYETGENDSVVVSMENACDVECNIRIACMQFQNSLDYFKGNILMAIQSHNYGKYMLDLILNKNYDNIDSIKNSYDNIGWIEYVKDAYENPWKYISNWDQGNYGDGDYIEKILGHCPTSKVSVIYNNNKITYKLDTLEVTEKKELGTNKQR